MQEKAQKMYFPTRGQAFPKASEVRKILSDFKKIAIFPYDTVDVILYRVEMAVDFTNTYGDIDERFYDATENAYEDALKIIKNNGLQEHFLDRCLKIVAETHDIGWGFADGINHLTKAYLK